MTTYKANVHQVSTNPERVGSKDGVTTFTVEAGDYLSAQGLIRAQLKKLKLPPVRAMVRKALQEVAGVGPVDVLVYLQEVDEEPPKDLDFQWKKPLGSKNARRR